MIKYIKTSKLSLLLQIALIPSAIFLFALTPEYGIFRVDRRTTVGMGEYPSAAFDSQDNFMMSWMMNDRRDNCDYKIYARLYNSECVPLGNDFRVNTGLSAQHRVHHPTIVVDDNDIFTVVWAKHGGGIFAKRYKNSGDPISDEFRVDADSSGGTPHLSVGANNDIILVWRSDHIRARILKNGDAGSISEEIIVDESSEKNLVYSPVVASGNKGDFMVAWLDERNDRRDVYARLFNKNADPLGNDFLVAEANVGKIFYRRLSISVNSKGNYAIVWRDSRDGKCYIRLLDHGGLPLTEIQVVEELADRRAEPSVAVDKNDNFVTALGKHIRCYDENGNPITREIKLIRGFYRPCAPMLTFNSRNMLLMVWHDSRDMRNPPNMGDNLYIMAGMWDINSYISTKQE
ncbi:hypothetical protein GF312_18805 [Candidatus Poribacteria bacterium]|nr:hypothetical protein [Candidatus Poribacteria bacterium]